MAVAAKQIPVIRPIFTPDNHPDKLKRVIIKASPKEQTSIRMREKHNSEAPFFCIGSIHSGTVIGLPLLTKQKRVPYSTQEKISQTSHQHRKPVNVLQYVCVHNIRFLVNDVEN